MEKNARIFVAGHRGMVGSAICRKLNDAGYQHLILKTSAQLDLRNQQAVEHFSTPKNRSMYFLLRQKVGGIHANNVYRAEFLYENLMIEANVIPRSPAIRN